MSKPVWHVTNEKIGKYKCIRNRITQELVLIGSKGEIWVYSDTECSAVIYSHTIINKHTNPKEKYRRGEERIIKFSLNDLDKWVKLLGVKNNRKGMIKRAEKIRKI